MKIMHSTLLIQLLEIFPKTNINFENLIILSKGDPNESKQLKATQTCQVGKSQEWHRRLVRFPSS